MDKAPLGPLKEHQHVEYSSDDPSMNRIKGEGRQTITEWLWRKVGLGAVLLLLCCSPGICLIRAGLRDVKHSVHARRESWGRGPDTPAENTE